MRAVRDAPVFERLTLSEEDLRRGEMYQTQAERRKLETSAGSRVDFYRSLHQEAEIGGASAATLARVSQLTQKTNQFNLTTRRYTEEQIAKMSESPDWRVRWIRVRDQFSDNGLVGVAILHLAGSTWEIDTFLMSCRVIGRTVETAFLAHLIDEAEAGGGKRIQGWFLPTKKNAPACEFYSSHKFQPVEENGKGTLWALDLPQDVVRRPEWIGLKTATEDKMMAATIFEQVRTISADLFQVPAAQINPESSPETLESWDSVQHLNLVLGLEQEFNVQFEPEEMDRMKTIGAISDLVESKLKT